MHLDSDESVDSRRVSAIVYLNPMWKEGDGGELRLYPSWDNFLDIQPVNDRLVLFPSCRMPHRQVTTPKVLTVCS
jgi:SM-20-related protein